MSVSVPPILVLIVCKTILTGTPDQNAGYTHHEDRDWATQNSMMICQRHEVQLYDPQEGARLKPTDDPAPALTPNFADFGQCARAGIRLSIDWDEQHRGTPWRVWRVGCPAPIIDTRTGQIVGYKLPECGHRDTIMCEVDSLI